MRGLEVESSIPADCIKNNVYHQSPDLLPLPFTFFMVHPYIEVYIIVIGRRGPWEWGWRNLEPRACSAPLNTVSFNIFIFTRRHFLANPQVVKHICCTAWLARHAPHNCTTTLRKVIDPNISHSRYVVKTRESQQRRMFNRGRDLFSLSDNKEVSAAAETSEAAKYTELISTQKTWISFFLAQWRSISSFFSPTEFCVTFNLDL